MVARYLTVLACSLITVDSLTVLEWNIVTELIFGCSLSSQFWHDYRLAWNSTAYGGINSMVAAPEAIWTPPLVIENA